MNNSIIADNKPTKVTLTNIVKG